MHSYDSLHHLQSYDLDFYKGWPLHPRHVIQPEVCDVALYSPFCTWLHRNRGAPGLQGCVCMLQKHWNQGAFKSIQHEDFDFLGLGPIRLGEDYFPTMNVFGSKSARCQDFANVCKGNMFGRTNPKLCADKVVPSGAFVSFFLCIGSQWCCTMVRVTACVVFIQVDSVCSCGVLDSVSETWASSNHSN